MNKNHLRTNPNPNPKQCEEKYLFLNKAFSGQLFRYFENSVKAITPKPTKNILNFSLFIIALLLLRNITDSTKSIHAAVSDG